MLLTQPSKFIPPCAYILLHLIHKNLLEHVLVSCKSYFKRLLHHLRYINFIKSINVQLPFECAIFSSRITLSPPSSFCNLTYYIQNPLDFQTQLSEFMPISVSLFSSIWFIFHQIHRASSPSKLSNSTVGYALNISLFLPYMYFIKSKAHRNCASILSVMHQISLYLYLTYTSLSKRSTKSVLISNMLQHFSISLFPAKHLFH